MDPVPIQCKRLRRSIRRQRHVFMNWLSQSSFCHLCPPGISLIVTDFCLPSRRFVDAIEAEIKNRTRLFVYIENSIGHISYLWHDRYTSQGFTLAACSSRSWGCTVRDLLAIYLGEPKEDGSGTDMGFVDDAKTLVSAFRITIDEAILRHFG
jgi:hypothetical protein